MMAQRLRVTNTASSSPASASASAPRTRPFEVQPPPAPLYSSTEPWNPSRSNSLAAPSRPPKIYDGPPPSLSYRPAIAPERRASADSNRSPTLPAKLPLQDFAQRPHHVRQPTPPTYVHARSSSTDQRSSLRASAIYPPVPQLAEIKPSSPFEVDPPQLSERRPSRLNEVDSPSEPIERRGSRPFEVRPAPLPFNLSSDSIETLKQVEVPFRSPILFPPVSSRRPSKEASPSPTAGPRKGSAHTFEFEPPVQTTAESQLPVQNPSPALQTSGPAWPLQQDLEQEPFSPKSKPAPLSFDDIPPPPGPPPVKRKAKKSVSFAVRDSLISPGPWPYSPFSDDDQQDQDSSSSNSMAPSYFPYILDDDGSNQADLPIFLRIEESAPAPAPVSAPSPSAPLTDANESGSETPPPLPARPSGSRQEQRPQDQGMEFDAAVAQLVDYGFTTEEAQRGLLENGSGIDVQAAANWLLDEANQPEPPPLPRRPGAEPSPYDDVDPPSPLSPSDDASSDLYEPEPVSPISLMVSPKANAGNEPTQQRFSQVFAQEISAMASNTRDAQPPSPPSEKQDSSSFPTYRPSGASSSHAPPSPPSSAPSLEHQDQQDLAPGDLPPPYSASNSSTRFPNPLLSHPVHVAPTASGHAQHRIPRKRIPLPALDTQVSAGPSASRNAASPNTKMPAPVIAAGAMSSFAAAATPATSQDFTPLSHHSTESSVSSITSAAVSPSSSKKPRRNSKKGKEPSSTKGWGSRFAKGFSNLAFRVNHAGFKGEPMDKECEKAARILRAFCKHGVYANPSNGAQSSLAPEVSAGESTQPSSSKSEKKLVRIPPEVLQKAVGLAIFTTLRVGLGIGESTGSGVVIARLHDGSWSPPSAIQLQSFGAGVAAGVDLFDCVCVINTQDALSAFMNTRFSLGAGVAVAAGPWGTGRKVEWGSMHNQDRPERNGKKNSISEDEAIASPPPVFELNGEPLAIPKEPKNRSRGNTITIDPVYSYVKSKGLFAGFSYDGNVVIERKGSNCKFYKEPVTVEEILRGRVRAPENSEALRALQEALMAAEDHESRRGSAATVIQTEGSEDVASEEQPQQTWPADVKPKFPEDSLHPAEAYWSRPS